MFGPPADRIRRSRILLTFLCVSSDPGLPPLIAIGITNQRLKARQIGEGMGW